MGKNGKKSETQLSGLVCASVICEAICLTCTRHSRFSYITHTVTPTCHAHSHACMLAFLLTDLSLRETAYSLTQHKSGR